MKESCNFQSANGNECTLIDIKEVNKSCSFKNCILFKNLEKCNFKNSNGYCRLKRIGNYSDNRTCDKDCKLYEKTRK